MKKSTLSASMKANIKIRNDTILARRVVTIGVLVSSVMVGVSLFVSIYFDPEAVAKRKFEEMAKAYYEDYYYDKLMKTLKPETKEEKLALFAKTGVQSVPLRQLLLYQNGKFADYKGYFERDGYECDKNNTTAVFYPTEPYGREDYTVSYKYNCVRE